MTWRYSDIAYRAFFWHSWGFGILIVVLGSLRRAGFTGRHTFMQTLFIATSRFEHRCFICNDVLNFTGYITAESVTTLPPCKNRTIDYNDDPIPLRNVVGIQDFLHFYLQSAVQVFNVLLF